MNITRKSTLSEKMKEQGLVVGIRLDKRLVDDVTYYYQLSLGDPFKTPDMCINLALSSGIDQGLHKELLSTELMRKFLLLTMTRPVQKVKLSVDVCKATEHWRMEFAKQGFDVSQDEVLNTLLYLRLKSLSQTATSMATAIKDKRKACNSNKEKAPKLSQQEIAAYKAAPRMDASVLKVDVFDTVKSK